MDFGFLEKVNYSLEENLKTFPPHPVITNSLNIINNYFNNNSLNKLCLVFPFKDKIAQWLSIPLAISLFKDDFIKFRNESSEFYKDYKRGDFLKLNSKAIVKWLGYNERGIQFESAEEPPHGHATFTVPFTIKELLQPVGKKDLKLSKSSRVNKFINIKNNHPVDYLLQIYTGGNFNFLNSSICLVGKIQNYHNSIDNVLLSGIPIKDYFEESKINEKGELNIKSPLVLCKNLANLFMRFIEHDDVNIILIDGFSYILERLTDFSGIDSKNVPTVLITDLSEFDNFDFISKCGFRFFNFTKEFLNYNNSIKSSPFQKYDDKLNNYLSFNIKVENCNDEELEIIFQQIHLIEKDESNNDLNIIRISLIMLANLISRIAYIPNREDTERLISRLDKIALLFENTKIWLGESAKFIEKSLEMLKSIINKYQLNSSNKCIKLKELLYTNNFDYIICQNKEEIQMFKNFFSVTSLKGTKIISLSDINENLLSGENTKVIVVGWLKSINIYRIISSFLFSEITFLFYNFEIIYFNSLQDRYSKYLEYANPKISEFGLCLENEELNNDGFNIFPDNLNVIDTIVNNSIDIIEYELRIDDTQYSKYKSDGNLIESIKAKRIDFEKDMFVYSSESHKFLVITQIISNKNGNATLYRKKVDFLNVGDIIALINTERDILVEVVEKITNPEDYASIKKWTDLWKNLLKKYFLSIGGNFKVLIENLRKYDCKKHEVTIRNWLQDENMIGPEDDNDLISIALLTESNELNENIDKVRNAIGKMTGWRMRASDYITDKIKSKIHELANSSILNKKITIEGLGSISVLRVTDISNIWEKINVKYVNRPLKKDMF